MHVDLPIQNIHNRRFRLEGFPSGQRDQTVNLTALPSKVRILPPPPIGTLADILLSILESRLGSDESAMRAKHAMVCVMS